MRAVLAYDASAGADQAASLVRDLPWPAETTIHVVGVVEPATAMAPAIPIPTAWPVIVPEIEAEISGHLQDEIDRVVGQLRAAKLAVEGKLVVGRPATVLVDEARQLGADLVVAGSRGHGPIASLVLGSVSAELVDRAPCPVFVARGVTARRVLFASDGSGSSSDAEQALAEWPIFDGAMIRVVSVAEVIRPWHTGVAPTMYREVMEAYAKDLEAGKAEHGTAARNAADRLKAAGRTVEVRLRIGDAAAEIIDEATEWNADLVVLGSRGMTGLPRILVGSVARNVLQGSHQSVLVVRGGEAEPAAEGAAPPA